MMKQTLVLGVGNLLLGDEGVGIHAVRALEKETLPAGVDLLDGGVCGLHLINWLEGYERIVMIDATLDNRSPGSVRRLRPRCVDDFPRLMSAHEIGLRDMIAALLLMGHSPEIDLIVVSAGSVGNLGICLTPPVAAAMPEIIRQVMSLLSPHPKKASVTPPVAQNSANHERP
jgi:hydrogenase maturation protease